MKAPLVSIVTPTYNHEKYIAPCIESVLGQTYENWEMLIVDDGSTDATVAKAESYKDPRIRVFREQNRGMSKLAETYNIAVANSKGSLIAILEGDDFWAFRKLELQVIDFEDPTVVMSWGRAVQMTEDCEPISLAPHNLPPWDGRLNIPYGRAAFYMSSCLWQTFTFALTVVIRKDALYRIGGFQQPSYAEYLDLATFMTLSLEGAWRFHPDVVAYWRRHIKSTTHNRYPAMLNAAYRWSFEFLEKHGACIPADRPERDELDKIWNVWQKDRLLTLGRMLAADGKPKEAIPYFEQALRFRIGKRTRKMIGAAIFLCKVGRSPESAFHFGRQHDWRTQLAATNGDPLVTAGMKPDEFVPYDLMKTMPK